MKIPKRSQQWLAPNFVARDFDCPCEYCTETLVEMDLVMGLQEIRDRVESPVFISKGGGYRCARYQQILRDKGYETSVGPSQHELGRAADITCHGLSGLDLEAHAHEAGFMAIGVGKGFIHVDLRPEHHRWAYTKD